MPLDPVVVGQATGQSSQIRLEIPWQLEVEDACPNRYTCQLKMLAILTKNVYNVPFWYKLSVLQC